MDTHIVWIASFAAFVAAAATAGFIYHLLVDLRPRNDEQRLAQLLRGAQPNNEDVSLLKEAIQRASPSWIASSDLPSVPRRSTICWSRLASEFR